MKLIFLSLIVISSCTHLAGGPPREGKHEFNFIDSSGRFAFTREHKLIKTKLISRSQIATERNSPKPLEKSIAVSQLGTINEKGARLLVVRPFASEFTVWLDGKRYHSEMKLDPKSKSLVVKIDSPEEKWNGQQSYPVPKGKQFCFFSQLPECLYHNKFLERALNRKGDVLNFYVVWDSFPFVQEQFTGIGSKIFSPASLRYDGLKKSLKRYQVEVEGQTILYQFSKSFDLVKMFWIAQGLSVVQPGEDVNEIEE